MRGLFAFLVVTLLCGCSNRLEPLARGLESAWKPQPHELKLVLRAQAKDGHTILHCVLSNVNWQSIDVDASGLPWLMPYRFSVDAVTAGGRVIHKDPPVEIAHISGPRRPVPIAPGQSMEGEVDLMALPIGDLPRGEDLLLLWSYWIGDGHSDKGVELSGVTLLKATWLRQKRLGWMAPYKPNA